MTEELKQLLINADRQFGFPMGTMNAVLQQETRGNQKYIQDPTAYHYPLNANGKRIAKHTGKISTAFGPFGILESTAADPGYGVKPLQDKSLQEQVRFASEYLAARAKRAGGLEQGLASYGEGPKYAQAVLNRLGNVPAIAQAQPAPVPQPVQQAPQNDSAQLLAMQQYGTPQISAYGGGIAGSLQRLLM